jgi:tripartite-type tricarboxylate transporter receptor subunit TctC
MLAWIARLTLFTLAAMAPACAQTSVEQFYRGKTLTIVVGSAPGGGYDLYGRLVQRHLGRFIPGAPTVVVQNMPGAGSNRAAGYVAIQAPRDGTTIGTVMASAIMWPLMSDQPLQHDPSKFIMVGSANRSVYFCLVRSDAPVKTFAETFDREVIIGTSGEGATLREMPVMLVNVLGVKLRLVGGYTGSRDIIMAMERNEVQGMCGMDWSSMVSQRRDWIDSGFVRPLVQEDLNGHPEMNGKKVPLAIDFAKTTADRQVMEIMYSGNMFGRPYLLPPGVPQDRVDALRKAFSAMVVDEQFLAEATKAQMEISPMTGTELQEVVDKLYAMPASVIEKLKRSMIHN